MGSPSICPHSLFSNILMGFCSEGSCECTANLRSVALPIPEVIAIRVLNGGFKHPILGKRRRSGSGMIPFKTALVSSYRAPIVTFPLSSRISEILPLLCSSTPLFPTPPLLSPKISNQCHPDPPMSQTDIQIYRRTDGRHAIAIPHFVL